MPNLINLSLFHSGSIYFAKVETKREYVLSERLGLKIMHQHLCLYQ